ncbi:MAG: DUF3795 domain-containing protein [Bacteroidales bacterium]|nr:MAG: DUF3795 domain-containing protein [Bacteroidales bacterium]
MEDKIAYCGLACDSCPIHLATYETDKSRQRKMRTSIAEICSEKYGMNLRPVDITDCDGCRTTTGRLFFGCRNCEIRKCVKNRSLDSCAYCPDYACDKLEDLFHHDPEAQVRIKVIRSKTRK